MKRRILSLALMLALAAGGAAQDKPNFAGTWKEADSFNRTTITIEGSRMTVTRTLAGNSEATVYMLDGTPSKKTIPGPGGKPIEQVYTSTWDGAVLVTEITTLGPTPMIEKRSIEADGTMKVERTMTMQGKTQTNAQVFRKVG